MKTPTRKTEFRYLPAVAAIFVLGTMTLPQLGHTASRSTAVAPSTIDSIPRVSLWSRDTLSGLSGKLRMKRHAATGDTSGILAQLFGDSAARTPGVYAVTDTATKAPFHFVNLVPFSAKKRGLLEGYRMGSWPAERSAVSDRYANPTGFIRVTRENQDTYVSEHFRLRDFLTKDQTQVWPKYLVLEENLLDKLELVIGALKKHGVNVGRMSVMSGFRTPQYNDRGVGSGGRASNSRHQYGDAADVYVDSDGDGNMDDLNGDGRVNTSDARFLAKVVESVEAEHPSLTGGMGIYPATSAHGPFVHVDVRGVRARW